MTEEIETIDKTQWLPKGVNIINEHRLAKEDIVTWSVEGEIRTAQAMVNNLVNFLHVGRVISNDNLADAQLYEIWKICFTSEFQIKENRIYYPREIQGMQKILTDADLDVAEFERVILTHRGGLTAKEKEVIEQCLQPGATDHMRWWATRNEKHIKVAFNHLTEIMEKLRDEHRERHEIKNYLRNP